MLLYARLLVRRGWASLEWIVLAVRYRFLSYDSLSQFANSEIIVTRSHNLNSAAGSFPLDVSFLSLRILPLWTCHIVVDVVVAMYFLPIVTYYSFQMNCFFLK